MDVPVADEVERCGGCLAGDMHTGKPHKATRVERCYLQWRFANARVEAVLYIQSAIVEWKYWHSSNKPMLHDNSLHVHKREVKQWKEKMKKSPFSKWPSRIKLEDWGRFWALA
ncbi:DUF566 protein [Spatholobus suberectus]|nr:DUF566 protein [Spatholobus suberectus]